MRPGRNRVGPRSQKAAHNLDVSIVSGATQGPFVSGVHIRSGGQERQHRGQVTIRSGPAQGSIAIRMGIGSARQKKANHVGVPAAWLKANPSMARVRPPASRSCTTSVRP